MTSSSSSCKRKECSPTLSEGEGFSVGSKQKEAQEVLDRPTFITLFVFSFFSTQKLKINFFLPSLRFMF